MDMTLFRRCRRSVSFLAVITALLAVPALAAEYASVAKDGVNIRSGPDTKQEALWEVFKDYPVQILKKQGDWAQIADYQNDKGWILTQLLANKKTVIVKVDSAKLRTGPGTNYETSANVKEGVVFKALKKEGDWIEVAHENGTGGWIHNTLVWPNNPF